MDSSTPINRSGKVMVSVASLRRLISNSYQSEVVEEMMADVLADRTGVNAYRITGLAANCQDILQQLDPGTVPACNGIIYLDRERHCDECGRQVSAEEVVNWLKEAIRNGEVVKSYRNMDTEEFWDGHWAEFERIENADAGELARMVGG